MSDDSEESDSEPKLAYRGIRVYKSIREDELDRLMRPMKPISIYVF